MKKFLIVALLLVSFKNFSQINSNLSKEQYLHISEKLRKYFKEYENPSPQAVREAKFNDYVNEVNPSLSKSGRKKAFQIVDAYIRASQGEKINTGLNKKQKMEIENLLMETQRKKQNGMRALNGKLNEIRNMSYPEYKNYVTGNGNIPLPENDIRKSYNQMHASGGKKIEETPGKNKMDSFQALDIIRHPEKYSYSQYKSAFLFIQPDISEEQIKEAWNKAK